MKLSLFNFCFIGNIMDNKLAQGDRWLENEAFQRCLKKARLQRGILQPLEEIAIRKEREESQVAGGEPQFKMLELGDGFVAIIDYVNQIVKVDGWTELGMFKFELCLYS
ncbi:MAG: hypothetical protein AAFY11_00770 [Cyanobacteria bacterium J06641_5]